MFITQLLNRASSMMCAAIQKQKTKQKTKNKNTKKKTQKKPQKQKHNACSHASSASNVHAFSTLNDGRNERAQTCEGLSSERPVTNRTKY